MFPILTMWLQKQSNIMKKITILFATLLAMSGMAFGQKELKQLWEKDVFNVSGGNLDPLSSMRVSPNGNIFTLARPGGITYFDKNGNKMGLSNLKTPFDENTYPILNKDFEIVGTFDLSKTRKDGWSLNEEEDGVLVVNLDNDKAVKYDLNGKISWQYNYEGKGFMELKNRNPRDFYFFLESKSFPAYKAFIVNKKGKKIGEIDLDYSPDKIVFSNDKSIWILKSGKNVEFTKYDSTGAKIQVIQPKTYTYDDIFTFTSQNSVVMSSISADSKQIIFTRIDTKGNEKMVSKKTDELKSFLQSYDKGFNYTVRMEMIDENKFRFLISSGNDSAMGIGSFEDSNFGWITEAKNANMAKNTFVTITNNNITSYNLDGTVKWTYLFSGEQYPLNSYDPYNNIQNFIYVEYVKDNQHFISKIQIEDGKTIWTQTKNKEEIVNIRKDSEENDYLIYRNSVNTKVAYDSPYSYRIIMISKLSQKALKYYESLNPDWAFYGPPLLIDFKNNTLTTFPLENQNGGYKFILRKYSTRCLYDSDSVIVTANKTEACPTEKVKLSIPKQDGITYQWQKDGKDIPNSKDVVYDFGESGTYTVVAKDELCENSVTSNEIKINIRPLPTAEITAPKSTFCDGEKVTIASRTNGTFFQWQKDGKDIPNATSGIYEVSQAGDYRVGVRGDKCPQVGYSNIYTIITKLLPEASITTDIKGVVYEPVTVKMSANSGTGLAYQWLKDDAIIPNETKATYEAQKSGKYNVNVTYDGCTKLSDALTISILIPLANQEEVGEEEVKVYP
ncbi:MAG: putative retaining b-glycosidase, glycoside hydrolase family 5 protein, partial [Bacteroidota bacterium]